MKYYTVTFTNGFSRANMSADSPEEAAQKAEAEMPQVWKDNDEGVINVEKQDHHEER